MNFLLKQLRSPISIPSFAMKKIKNTTRQAAEKEFFFGVDNLTNDYMSFMRQNGVINQSFFKGTFIGDDLNFCNEIRAAIETTISETKKN